MIEYVLVLIIMLTMLFLAKGLFTNLNNYISGYIGGYFKCLMTQGELPALGVSDSDLSRHTGAGYKCTAEFKKTDGSNQAGAGGGKNVGTTTQLSSDKPKGSTEATASRRGGSDSSAKSKSSASKRKGGNRSNSSSDDDDSARFSNNVRNRSDAYSSSDGEGDDNVRSVPMKTRDLASERTERYRAVSGEMEASIKKKTRGGGVGRATAADKIITIKATEENRPGPRTSKFNPPERRVAAIEEEPEVDMGFGYFMKWIMIAGIGIAIFIFFGGQIMNYNNSDG
jgi:hypothetical protein